MHELDQIVIHYDKSGVWVLNIAMAIVMFGVAIGLKLDDFKLVLKQPKLVLLGLLSQYVLLPLLTFVFVLLVKPIPSIALGLFMIAACPGGNVSNFFSSIAKANVALSVSLTAVSSIIALILTPLNFTLLASLYQPTDDLLTDINLNPMEIILTIILVLGLPLFIGMFTRHKFENFCFKIDKPFRIISITIFVLVIVISVANNFETFISNITYVFLIVIVHNTLAMLMGYNLGRIFGYGKRERRTLSIETGIQNAGLGLLLIFSFFGSLGGMALLAAWWGIWDMIAGLGMAYLWGNKELKS